MSWMKMACDAYEQNAESMVANFQKGIYLCPISHMEASAQIEISLDLHGNLTAARSIENREDADCIIPVTEESAGRSSGIAPHPLCDNLTYVAGDYPRYARTEQEAKNAAERHARYLEGLAAWRNSAYDHAILDAVYAYLSKACLLTDLIAAAIVKTDANGKLSSAKIAGKTYDKCLVRFQIDDFPGEGHCWQNRELIAAYQQYYLQTKCRESKGDICYLTGECGATTDNHPKGTLKVSYGAKLISANDSTDFTFRGRFRTAEEASAISYEASQKAHLALQWLVRQQGLYVGGSRCFLCWNPSGKDVQLPGEDLFGSTALGGIFARPTTMPAYREKLCAYINGQMTGTFTPSDDVAIMAMEAATPGRLSIVYYNELKAPDFFGRIQAWYQSCCWAFPALDADGRWHTEVKSPTARQVVRCAYGIEREAEKGKASQSKTTLQVSDKLMIMQYQRLFRCIVEGQRLPRDFVDAIFRQCSKLETFSRGTRERILSTGCALIRKHWDDMYGKELEMALNRSESNRDYCYGRLLAVYEWVERGTYSKDETREPNAIRLQTIYAQHPASTRMLLEQKLLPYFASLSPAARQVYRGEIGEISELIGMDRENKPLGYLYIIGYYAEREDLRKRATKNAGRKDKTEEEAE